MAVGMVYKRAIELGGDVRKRVTRAVDNLIDLECQHPSPSAYTQRVHDSWEFGAPVHDPQALVQWFIWRQDAIAWPLRQRVKNLVHERVWSRLASYEERPGAINSIMLEAREGVTMQIGFADPLAPSPMTFIDFESNFGDRP